MGSDLNIFDHIDLADLPDAATLDRELAKKSLLEFTTQTHHEYNTNFHHEVTAAALDDFVEFKKKRLIIIEPPRRGKSELASRRLPAYIFGRNPNAGIIAGSYNQDLANMMSRDVQRIMESDKYAEIFPDTYLAGKRVELSVRRAWKKTNPEFEIVNHRGAYKCVGVGTGVTGRGANYIIIDDPVKSRKEANSETQRQVVWDWYTDDIMSRLEVPGAVLIMATRWHEDDLIGRVIEREGKFSEGGLWHVIHFPEIQDAVDCDKRPYDPREPGKALWPGYYLQPDEDEFGEIEYDTFGDNQEPVVEMRDAQEVLEERAQAAHIERETRNAFGNTALYQGRPYRPGGNILKNNWLLDNRWTALPPEACEWLLAVDPKAGGMSSSSSYAVFELWCKPRDKGEAFLIDQIRERIGFVETCDLIRSLLRTAPWSYAETKLVEAKADGKAIVDTLRTEFPGFQEFVPKGSKEDRWESVAPFWASGNVHIPDERVVAKARTWMYDFVEEHTRAPAYPTDDQIDCSTMVLIYWFVAPEKEDTWQGWFDDSSNKSGWWDSH